MLWIRLQIGSIFSNLVDPDPYSEHGSRSGYTQTQTDINSPSQSKLSSCAFNFVLYSLKKVFWKYKLYKKIDYELCEKVRFRIQIAANFRIWIQIKVYLDSQHWCSLQYCKNTIQCTYTYMWVHRTLQVFVLQNKTFLGWTFSPNMLFVEVHPLVDLGDWFRPGLQDFPS